MYLLQLGIGTGLLDQVGVWVLEMWIKNNTHRRNAAHSGEVSNFTRCQNLLDHKVGTAVPLLCAVQSMKPHPLSKKTLKHHLSM